MILYSFFAIPSFMATAFVIVLVSLKKDEYVPYVAITGAAMALFFSLLSVPQVLSGHPVTMQMEEWIAPFGITIFGDCLSVFLSAVVAMIGLLTIVFSYSYIRERRTKYYALLSLLFAGLFGVIHTGDLFNLFVFVELMSIASYGLVAFNRDNHALEASIKYLIIGSLGTTFFLIGVAFIYGLTGSLNMADVAGRLAGMSGPALTTAFAFMLSGLAIKAGLVPFHTWLPDAHPAAPSPVSAVLSGLMIGVSVYALMRVGYVVFSAPALFLNMLLVLGSASMLVGGVAALRQSNLKRMLAYSSVSQMGYIAFALGLGTALGVTGGIFHLVNQSVIKGLLFLCSGVIIYNAGTCDFDRLSGMFSSSRLLSFSFLAGVLALAGVPLSSGFASKWLIYAASYEVNPFLTLLAVMVSAITLAYGIKAYSMIFSRSSRKSERISFPLSMKIPLAILAVIILLMGIFPWTGIWMSELMAAGLDSASYIEGVPV